MYERRPEATSRTLGNSQKLRTETSEHNMYNTGSWKPREENFKKKSFQFLVPLIKSLKATTSP